MSNITTRVLSASGATLKNAPLSNAEIDTNFINLNNEKVETADAVSTNTANKVVKRDGSGNFAANQVTVSSIVTGSVTYPTTNVTQAQMEAGLDTTTRYMSASNIKQAIDILAMQSVGNVTKDMTGFETIIGSSLSYVDATRTFTIAPSGTTATSKTFVVTVSAMKYIIDGVSQATLELVEGGTYTFDLSDPSNAGHPLRFSTTNNGTHSGGTEYTSGVTVVGNPGSAGAYVRIVVPSSAPTLYYYCANHSNMGGVANTIQAYFVWYRGKRITISSSLSITLPATPGLHFIGINPTSVTLERFDTADTIFTDTILVASIYLDTATTKGIIVGDERHSSARDTAWQLAQHNAVGAVWLSGGTMSFTLDNDSATTLSFSSPILLADEDLVHTISHATTPSGYFQQTLTGTASLPTLYLNGTTYSEIASSTTPWVAGTSTARINQISSGSGSLADAGEGKFLNYWIVATNDIVRPIKAIMGRTAFNTKTEAYAEQLIGYGLPFVEFAPMYQVTLLTQGSFAGNKVRIVNVRTIFDRQGASANGFVTPQHSSLASLNSDDHTQYVHTTVARTISANHTFSGSNTFSGTNGFNRITVNDIASNFVPTSNNTYDLGSSTNAWRNVYTNDLHLSNEAKPEGNDVDGTTGNWTIQEGQENLYIINNKTGKRYKFSLEEI